MDTSMAQVRPSRADTLGATGTLGVALPFLALLVVGIAFPLFGGGYWGVIATRACVYWVLVSGLNLVVGFAGQIAIGWVALLTLGAYTTSVLVAGNVTPELPPYLALAIAAVVGAVFGLIIGLPALRLRTFYFAITTLGFATIVTQVALGGMGNNRGAVAAGLLLGLFQQTANFLVGGIFASVAVFTVFIIVLLARPEGLAGAAVQRRL